MRKNPVVLAAAVLLFAGWLTYLGVQALRDRRPAVVSRAQLAASQYDVEVDLEANPDGSLPRGVTVRSVRWAADNDRPAGEIEVLNINSTQGYSGRGAYLLPLVRRDKGYVVAAPPLDPGYFKPEGKDPPKPRIYPVSPGVERQWEAIRRP